MRLPTRKVQLKTNQPETGVGGEVEGEGPSSGAWRSGAVGENAEESLRYADGAVGSPSNALQAFIQENPEIRGSGLGRLPPCRKTLFPRREALDIPTSLMDG